MSNEPSSALSGERATAVLTVRRVHEDEAAALTRLARATFEDTYRPMCEASEVDGYLSTNLTEALVTDTLRDPDHEALVVIDGAEWVGYAIVRWAALPLQVPPVSVTHPMELVRFYVRHSHHGRGVAAVLFEGVRQACVRNQSDGLWLQAWQENARAVAFYQKTGFRIVGTTTFNMGGTVQDDFVMLRTESHTSR